MARSRTVSRGGCRCQYIVIAWVLVVLILRLRSLARVVEIQRDSSRISSSIGIDTATAITTETAAATIPSSDPEEAAAVLFDPPAVELMLPSLSSPTLESSPPMPSATFHAGKASSSQASSSPPPSWPPPPPPTPLPPPPPRLPPQTPLQHPSYDLPQSTKTVRIALSAALQQWTEGAITISNNASTSHGTPTTQTAQPLEWSCHGGTRIEICDRAADRALLRKPSVQKSRNFPHIDAHPVDEVQIRWLEARALRRQRAAVHSHSSSTSARQPSQSRSLILTAASYNHLHLLLNWLAALKRTGSIPPSTKAAQSPPGWGLVCLDKPLHAFLETFFPAEKGGGCYYSMSSVPDRYDAFTGVGFMKATVVASLIRRGVSVLLMDTDAVPIGYAPMDIIPFLSEDIHPASVDVFASQSSMPEECSGEWGFSLNLGWIWFRGSTSPGEALDVDRTVRLLDLTVEHMEMASPRPGRDSGRGSNPNDQISMNLVLWAAGVHWYRSTARQRPGSSLTSLDFDWGVVTGETKQKSAASVASLLGGSGGPLADLQGLKLAMSSPKATYRSTCEGAVESGLLMHNIHCDARNHEKVFALQRARVWFLHDKFTTLFAPSDERRKRFFVHWLDVSPPAAALASPSGSSGSSWEWFLSAVAGAGDFSGVRTVRCGRPGARCGL